MEYLAAVDAVIKEVRDPHLPDGVVIRDGLALVLCGWRLNTSAAYDRAWDVLGTAAQEALAEFHHLPPVTYLVDPAADQTSVWTRTGWLVGAIAERLDRIATDDLSDAARAWQLATSAARLRTALPEPI